jgi:dephospho-CoA kinase
VRKPSQPLRPRPRLVIGIAGRIGSGKTTAARYLATKHNFKYVRYSQVLREQFKANRDRKELRALGWEIMSSGKQQHLNSLLLKRIKGREDYVVEGLRHPLDHWSLKNRFRNRFRLVYIEAPTILRRRRLGQAGRIRTMMEFKAADRHPVEGNVLRLRAKADIVVRNTGSLEQLHRRLDRIVNRARKGGQPWDCG